MDTEMVILGRVIASYGLKGWVRIHPFGDDPEGWRAMPDWYLSPSEQGPWQKYALAGFKAKSGSLTARFSGVADCNAADLLKSCWIGVPRENLPPAGDNEFYWSDLIGMDVENLAKEPLGKVSGLLETGAHDVLRVLDDAGNERLLPFVDAIVQSVDKSSQKIRVDWQLDWN